MLSGGREWRPRGGGSGLNISIIHHHEEMTQACPGGGGGGSGHGSGYREFAAGNFLPNVQLTALVSSDL